MLQSPKTRLQELTDELDGAPSNELPYRKDEVQNNENHSYLQKLKELTERLISG